MNIEIKNYVPFLLEGGEIPLEAPVEGAPQEAPAEGGDPAQLIMEAAMAALQNQDCNLAMQVLQAIVEMLGGGAPAPEQAPVYKMGGKFSHWTQK